MAESLTARFPWLADFLAARDWGLLRLAVTEPDQASRGRGLLLLAFARLGGETYEVPIYSDKEAAAAYQHIVEYLKEHGYDKAEYFERIGMFNIVYGNFRRSMDDLKLDLGIFYDDLPPMRVDVTKQPKPDAAHDLNALAERLGYTFEEAAAKLTASKKPARVLSDDPMSTARRIVRRYERRKDKSIKPSCEVLAAFSIINKDKYPRFVKPQRAAKKLAI